ncbi:hypothetical protein BGX28_001327 [Mortierella sp. GBA30]|nr:hypothetical protein BGX28_001327 [Mortierella sp. GBA30]
MTDSDFEDLANFDVKDISNLLKDIDSANLALDTLDGRADKLTESLASLLRAQSQPNPFADVDAASIEEDNAAASPVPSSTSTTSSTSSTAETSEPALCPPSTRAPPPSAASVRYTSDSGENVLE